MQTDTEDLSEQIDPRLVGSVRCSWDVVCRNRGFRRMWQTKSLMIYKKHMHKSDKNQNGSLLTSIINVREMPLKRQISSLSSVLGALVLRNPPTLQNILDPANTFLLLQKQKKRGWWKVISLPISSSSIDSYFSLISLWSDSTKWSRYQSPLSWGREQGRKGWAPTDLSTCARPAHSGFFSGRLFGLVRARIPKGLHSFVGNIQRSTVYFLLTFEITNYCNMTCREPPLGPPESIQWTSEFKG